MNATVVHHHLNIPFPSQVADFQTILTTGIGLSKQAAFSFGSELITWLYRKDAINGMNFPAKTELHKN